MSIIGKLHEINNSLVGYINTLQIRVNIRLVENTNRSNPNSPDKVIFGKAESGHESQIGAAWLKKSKEGKEFYSIAIDDPSFPTPLNVAAFFNEDTQEWVIQHRRRKGSAVIASNAPLNDEIPL